MKIYLKGRKGGTNNFKITTATAFDNLGFILDDLYKDYLKRNGSAENFKQYIETNDRWYETYYELELNARTSPKRVTNKMLLIALKDWDIEYIKNEL